MNFLQFISWLERQGQLSSSSYFHKPLIMGILNITPDSFSDGGHFLSTVKAAEHALQMIAQGADLVDIGGQSSRPGATKITADAELERVIPVIELIRADSDACISIDTYYPEVMEEAVKAGANMINDIFALRFPGALEAAARLNIPVCLMHMQGDPQSMQRAPEYPAGVVFEVQQFFAERIQVCLKAGIDEKNLILDPGFGFGKTIKHNLQLINHLDHFLQLKKPLLLGVSRKSTIGALLQKPVDERLIGSVTIAVYAALKGISILRVHDVDETKQALHLITQLEQA